jgi:putative tryptophan/tyrosine transport system substrate-binding protein
MLRKAVGSISILALCLLVLPLAADAQQPTKVYRIGFLGGSLSAPTEDVNPQECPRTGSPNWQAWVAGLRERGYIPGQNLVIECRLMGGQVERSLSLAAELVSLKVDLIVAAAVPRVRAAKQATSAIPIVMVYVPDPVKNGLIASLARPGGNVTGVTMDAGVEIVGKHLELLKEAVPKVSRVAVLGIPGSRAFFQGETEPAARALSVTLQSYEVREPTELEGAFAAMTKARAGALLVLPSPFIFAHARGIVDLAAKSRLPAVYPYRESVEAGGLMAYAVNAPDMWRRAAIYVDKILRGAKPADLPVEQPTKLDLVINLKTVKALGLTFPPSMLMRADEVIE